MIPLEEALAIVGGYALATDTEILPLARALGRALRADVPSPIDSPPFAKSSMDGFAIREEDHAEGKTLRVTAAIAAGDAADITFEPGCCARIMTGAMIPRGADRVIRREYVSENGSSITIQRAEKTRNIIERAAHLKAGQRVLTPRILRAPDLAILAGLGIDRVEVGRAPEIAVVSSGSELTAPGEALAPGMIYDSNAALLEGLFAELACPLAHTGIVRDDREETQALLDSLLPRVSLLVISGGAAQGECDYIPACLRASGVEFIINGVALKPGKGFIFGRHAGGYVCALPGNPMAVYALFLLFIRPFILRGFGIAAEERSYPARLRADIEKTDPDRAEFIPVRLRDGFTEALRYIGSSHLEVLSEADGYLLLLPAGASTLRAGEEARVRLLRS